MGKGDDDDMGDDGMGYNYIYLITGGVSSMEWFAGRTTYDPDNNIEPGTKVLKVTYHDGYGDVILIISPEAYIIIYKASGDYAEENSFTTFKNISTLMEEIENLDTKQTILDFINPPFQSI